MRAEDTVIDNKDIVKYHKKLFPWMYQGNDDDWCEEQLHRLITLLESSDVNLLLKAQAEVSIKTKDSEVSELEETVEILKAQLRQSGYAEQAGVRKVVEWLMLYKRKPEQFDSLHPFLRTDDIYITSASCQAKLKEWFKDNPELLKQLG